MWDETCVDSMAASCMPVIITQALCVTLDMSQTTLIRTLSYQKRRKILSKIFASLRNGFRENKVNKCN